MPYITDEQLDSLPQDPLQGLGLICEWISDFCQGPDGEDDSPIAIELHALLTEYINAHKLPYLVAPLPSDPRKMPRELCALIRPIEEQVQGAVTQKLESQFRSRFGARFGGVPIYTLTEGDIKEIHDQIAILRKLIGDSEALEEKHKARVLRRLEELQAEVHKHMSNYDKIVGVICDVLVIAKKAGETAEPWVRIAKSLLEIVWRSAGQSFELPSSAKMDLLK